MRFLVYNIAYGTGCPGGEARRVFTAHHYLRAPARPFRAIVDLVARLSPDMVGLVEADSGSFRTSGVSHPAAIETFFETENAASSGSKYGPNSILNRIPYLRSQTNALLSADPATELRKHYFPCGTKRLILEREMDGISVFLVHLGLRSKTRTRQLDFLRDFLPRDRPVALAGDFNTFRGEAELESLMRDLRLRSANTVHRATYPAWKPHRELDYILVSQEIAVRRFHVLPVRLSDHLPLCADLSLR